MDNLLTTNVGSYLYSAPEIFEDENYDDQIDLYSIGVTYFQMLFGIPASEKSHKIKAKSKDEDINFNNLCTTFIGEDSKNLLNNLICSKDKRMEKTEFFNHVIFEDIDENISKKIEIRYIYEKNCAKFMFSTAVD